MPALTPAQGQRVDVWSTLRPYVAERLARALDEVPGEAWRSARELRLRAGQRPMLVQMTGESVVGPQVSMIDLRECLEHLTAHSLYAWEEELAQGFVTIPGGHRVGVAGRFHAGVGVRAALRDVSGLNYRIARSVEGVAETLAPLLTDGSEILPTLLAGPPGCGKTTLLRDLVRAVSDGLYGLRARQVAVIDERSEIAACREGMPGRRVGARTDVIDGCPKVTGMRMAVRALGPEVLATDELGGAEDALAVLEAARSGVRVLATAHAGSLGDLEARPSFRDLAREGVFRRRVLLGVSPCPGAVLRVEDEHGGAIRLPRR